MNGSLHIKDLHHLIAQVVDDLDGNASGFGFVERSGSVAVEAFPCGFVNFGFQGGLERFIGIVRP